MSEDDIFCKSISVLLTKRFRDFKFDINFYISFCLFIVGFKNLQDIHIFFKSSYKPFSWINLLNCEHRMQRFKCRCFVYVICLFILLFLCDNNFVTIVKALLYFAELCKTLLMAGKIFIWLFSSTWSVILWSRVPFLKYLNYMDYSS